MNTIKMHPIYHIFITNCPRNNPSWFYRSRMKGLSSRALLKISFLADFCHFLKKSLNFILSQPNLVFGFNIVSSVLPDQQIIIIMPCYDFIVKFQNLDLKGLFRPSKKRDEPDIGLNGLK